METLPRKIESSRRRFPWFEAPEIDRSVLLVERTSFYGNQKRIGLKQRLAKSHKTILKFGVKCKFIQSRSKTPTLDSTQNPHAFTR